MTININNILSDNKIKYNDNIAIINTTNQISNKITNLDSNYKENNGLLIKIFNYNSTIFNSYISNFTNYFDLIIEILSLPNVENNLKININSFNTDIDEFVLQKSIFNNIPIISEFIETLGILEINELEKIFSNNINKNTQGNYPSIIFPLNIEQLNVIVNNKLFAKHYENNIPILVPWGLASPEILYKKYIADHTTQYDANRTIQSYILNNGPCYLDEISAYIEYLKIDGLYELHQNDATKFKSYFTYYNYGSYIAGPKLGESGYSEGGNYLLNYDSYSLDYMIDISQQVIFYLGIDNDYGWNHPKKVFEKLASRLCTIELDSYDISNNLDVTYRKSNNSLTDMSYTQYLNNIQLNSINITQNISNKNNPLVIMIKIPLFQTFDEYDNNIIGNGVLDSWNIANFIINANNADLSNSSIYNDLSNINFDLTNIDLSATNIFLRSYSQTSDLVSLKFLYDNSYLIPYTTGSIYDFIEENFKDTYFPYDVNNNTDAFQNLNTLKPYNGYAYKSFEKYIDKFTNNSNKINNLSNINELYETFDQIRFYELLANVNHLTLLINNVQMQKGILTSQEDIALNFNIYTGKDIFTSNYIFNYLNIATANGSDNSGFSKNNLLLFGDLISAQYNDSQYWDVSNAGPLYRNTSYVYMKRNTDLHNYHKWNLKYRRLNTIDRDGYGLFISSQQHLINSIIFELNGDANHAQYYNEFLDLYNKNTLIYDISDNEYSLNHRANVEITSNTIIDNISELNLSNIKKIVFGNLVTKISTFNNLANLREIVIGKNITQIDNQCFMDCPQLFDVSFSENSTLQIIGSQTFQNCSDLSNINIPDSVIYIYDKCFKNCFNLENVNLPSTLVILNNEVFQNCGKLASIDIPNAVQSIGANCFVDCSSLVSVNFLEDSNLNLINTSCFENCVSLQQIILPKKVTSLGSRVFFNCGGLGSGEGGGNITLNSALTEIGSSCFAFCISMNYINLENTAITTIQENTFEDCSNLNCVLIPNTLTTINQFAFKNCINLGECYILGSVTNLVATAFNGLDVITIYYFSNMTSLSMLENIVINNNANRTFIDLYNSPPDPSFNFKYNNFYNIKKYSEFIEPGYDFYYMFKNYRYDVSYNTSKTSTLDVGNLGNYNIEYVITTLNNITYNYTRNIAVVDEGDNAFFPAITLNGTNTQYIYINNTFNEYGYSATDLCDNLLNVYTDYNEQNNSVIGSYFIYYYTFDGSFNYISAKRTVVVLNINEFRLNMKINQDKSSIDLTSDVIYPKLNLTFENDGNIDENGETINNTAYSLFPIFIVSTNSSDSVDLSSVNGPPLGTSFKYNELDYYFVERISQDMFKNSQIRVINSGIQSYSKIQYFKPGTSAFYYGYTPPLISNDYLDVRIDFNLSYFKFDKNYAVFLDNGTEYYNSHFLLNGNNYEESRDTYGLYNDNVFLFNVPNLTNYYIEIKGGENITLEQHTKFVDPGVNFIFNNYPYNVVEISNNLDISNVGSYVINYIINWGISNVNEFSINVSRNINVVASNPNKPLLNIIGNKLQNIYIDSTYYDYGYEASDVSNNELIVFKLDNHVNALGTYSVDYYTYDSCGNYTSDNRTIIVNALASDFINLLINYEKTAYEPVNKKLTVEIQNSGLIDALGIVVGGVNYTNLSLWQVSSNQTESQNLTYDYGPPIDTSFVFNSTTYYFMGYNFANNNPLTSNTINIINTGSGTEYAIIDDGDYGGNLLYLVPPLKANDFITFEITFNPNNLVNSTSYAIFFDDGTFYDPYDDYLYNEGDDFETIETYDIPTDNIFVFDN